MGVEDISTSKSNLKIKLIYALAKVDTSILWE